MWSIHTSSHMNTRAAQLHNHAKLSIISGTLDRKRCRISGITAFSYDLTQPPFSAVTQNHSSCTITASSQAPKKQCNTPPPTQPDPIKPAARIPTTPGWGADSVPSASIWVADGYCRIPSFGKGAVSKTHGIQMTARQCLLPAVVRLVDVMVPLW
jgi:hypothetical protein